MDDRETMLDEDYTAIKRPSRGPWILLGLVLVAGAAAALVLWLRLQAARADLQATQDRAKAEQVELAQRVEKMETEKADLVALRNELSLQVQSKEEELAKLQSTYQELEAKMKDELASGDVRLSQSGGRIKVDLVDKILFDVGDASITARGENVLMRVGGVLGAVEDKKIQVSGHTDDLNISERLVTKYPTNWELAAARATNVVRFLEEKANVPGRRLVAAAYGPWEPIATNKTATGRARNRRIEIVLTPQLAPAPIDGPVAAKAGDAKAPTAAAVPAKATAAATKPAVKTAAAAPSKAAPKKKKAAPAR
jgi:chemotaxis protein MotB